MAGEEDLRARAVLAEMLMRISQGPHAALSINESASAEEVRGAFLELTKQFHPARFGRTAPDVLKMVNEVFLGIKGAHDQLVRMLGSSGRPAPRSSNNAVPTTNLTQGTARGTGLVPKPGPPGPPGPSTPVSPLTRGTDRQAPVTRPSTPVLTTSSAGTRASTPVLTTPSAGTPRAPTPLTAPAAGTRAPTPNAAGTRTPTPMTTPAAGNRAVSPPQRPTPMMGVPVQRQPSGEPERKLTPAAGVPAQPRPTSPQGIPRPTTPQRTPDAVNPPTVRYSGVQPKAGASTEDIEFQQAMNLLSSKDWTAARLAFHALAAKVPQSRQYRALLCYSRGRETQATGRNDDAALEFQRALQLDPDLQIAKDALRELGRKSRW